MIAKRMNKIDSSGIRKVFELGQKLKDPINLSIGQPDFDVPEVFKISASEAINEGFNSYTLTGGYPPLKEALLKKLEKDKNKSFEDIIITSGVSGALTLAFMALIDPGDEILIPDPYFVSYKHLVNLLDGVPKYINTYPDFSLTQDKLESAITAKSKILLLNSPANPTGKIYTKLELDTIANVAEKHNLLIISDEIYDLFCYDGNFHSVSEIYKNTLLLSGFSKTFAMTGWRLGYAAGPKEIIQEMTKLQQYTFVCAPSFAQQALLKNLYYNISKEVESYRFKRDLIYSGLDSRFNVQKSGGAFYAFPQVPNGSDMDFVEKAMNNNVLVIPGSVFSEEHTHFRISFATSDEKLKKGIEVLNSIID